MSRRSTLDDHPTIRSFNSAYTSLRATAREVFPRLTPVAPPPPRDSSPDAGMPEPDHAALAAAADDGPELAPASSRAELHEAWSRST